MLSGCEQNSPTGAVFGFTWVWGQSNRERLTKAGFPQIAEDPLLLLNSSQVANRVAVGFAGSAGHGPAVRNGIPGTNKRSPVLSQLPYVGPIDLAKLAADHQ